MSRQIARSQSSIPYSPERHIFVYSVMLKNHRIHPPSMNTDPAASSHVKNIDPLSSPIVTPRSFPRLSRSRNQVTLPEFSLPSLDSIKICCSGVEVEYFAISLADLLFSRCSSSVFLWMSTRRLFHGLRPGIRRTDYRRTRFRQSPKLPTDTFGLPHATA
jgi:hypothetical protein